MGFNPICVPVHMRNVIQAMRDALAHAMGTGVRYLSCYHGIHFVRYGPGESEQATGMEGPGVVVWSRESRLLVCRHFVNSRLGALSRNHFQTNEMQRCTNSQENAPHTPTLTHVHTHTTNTCTHAHTHTHTYLTPGVWAAELVLQAVVGCRAEGGAPPTPPAPPLAQQTLVARRVAHDVILQRRRRRHHVHVSVTRARLRNASAFGCKKIKSVCALLIPEATFMLSQEQMSNLPFRIQNFAFLSSASDVTSQGSVLLEVFESGFIGS